MAASRPARRLKADRPERPIPGTGIGGKPRRANVRRGFFISEGDEHAAGSCTQKFPRPIRADPYRHALQLRARLLRRASQEQAGRTRTRRWREARARSRRQSQETRSTGSRGKRPDRRPGGTSGRYGAPAGRWQGGHVCIIASGPSLTKEDVDEVRRWRQEGDTDPAQGEAAGSPARRVIVVNTTFQAAPWADVLYACDLTWWRHHFQRVATEFAGELWTVSEVARDQYGLAWVFGTDNVGLSPGPDYIHTGRNSGYQSIGLAHLFGAARVVLLGFDFMIGPAGERHWHGNHPKGLGNGGESRYRSWVQAMDILATDLKRTPCKVLNASRRTAIRSFQRVTLETALNENKCHVRGRDAGGLP